MWWQCLGNVSQMLTAVIAGSASIIGFRQWWAARRGLKRDVINDLYKEYMTEDMGKAKQALCEAFRASTGKQPEGEISSEDKLKWVDYYKQAYRSGDFRLHYQRRMVSGFYQRCAFSTAGNCFMTEIVLDIWGREENRFVGNVLLPIETMAMPALLCDKKLNAVPETKDWSPTWQRVWDFWKGEPSEKKNWMRRLCRRLQSMGGGRAAR